MANIVSTIGSSGDANTTYYAARAVDDSAETMQSYIDEYNRNNFNLLREEVSANGPGAYNIYYQYIDETNTSRTTNFTIMIGPNAVDANGNLNPQAINFHNPGSAMNGDIAYMDNRFDEVISASRGNRLQELGNYNVSTNANGSFDIHYATATYEQDSPYGSSKSGTQRDMDVVAPKFVADLAQSFEVSDDKVGFSGFSATGARSFGDTLNYLKNNPNATGVHVYCMEPSNQLPLSLSEEDTKLLNDRGAVVLDIHCEDYMTINNADYDGHHSVTNVHSNPGLHYYEVNAHAYGSREDMLNGEKEITTIPGNGVHGYVNQLFSSIGFGEITSGNFDWTSMPREFTINDNGDVNIFLNYEIIEHIPNPDGTVTLRPVSLEEMNRITGFKSNPLSLLKFARGQIDGAYTNLDFAKMDPKIISDLTYASDKFQDILTRINSSPLNEKLNVTLPNGSTTHAPQINIDTYNLALNSAEQINQKCEMEMFSLINTALKEAELDKNFANLVNDTINGGESVISSEPK